MPPWPVIVAGAVVLLLFVGGGDAGVAGTVISALESLTRGARLTNAPADETGYVDGDPLQLAAEAGYSPQAYAAGRMLSSEEGNSSPTTQAAVVWCLINKASNKGGDLLGILLKAKNPRNDGRFGSQKDKDPDSANFGGSDRYASTALDPHDRDCAIAAQCLDGTIPDLTGGATNFDRPAGEKHPEQVAADRVASRLVEVAVDGADAGLRFWRPA